MLANSPSVGHQLGRCVIRLVGIMCPHGKNILLCGKKAGQLRQDLFYYRCFEARFSLRHPFLLQVCQGLRAIVFGTVQLEFKEIL